MALLGGGGYGSRVAVHERMLMAVPARLDLEQAAAIPEVFLTAYDALVVQCALGAGESVLVHAVGSGVGTAAVQIAAQMGCRVFGTAGSVEKLARARASSASASASTTTSKISPMSSARRRAVGASTSCSTWSAGSTGPATSPRSPSAGEWSWSAR